MLVFQSTKSVAVRTGASIPARTNVTVLGSDGGTFIVQDLWNKREVCVSKVVFEESFVRWN